MKSAFVLLLLIPQCVYAAESVLTIERLSRLVFAMVVVLLLIATLAWLARRHLPISTAHHGDLRVVESLVIGHRERLVLVEVGARRLLLGVGPTGMQTLCELHREDTICHAALADRTS